ncbi:MAG TPA: hypothetical protein VHA14_19540 [Bryobacteraceae bacterium]|nr:hypothetical protein [Bryobacteraceae bacterium]
MKKTTSALSGIAMTLALAGASFAAQTTPAPAAKTAPASSSTASATPASKSDKKVVKKHSKTTKKSVAAKPAR